MSEQTKWTPGPWHAETVCADGWGVQIQGNRTGVSSVIVADMPIRFKTLPEGQHATWDHQKANARLIAAAPEMAALMERIAEREYRADRRHRGMVDVSEVEDIQRLCRALLARINGGGQ